MDNISELERLTSIRIIQEDTETMNKIVSLQWRLFRIMFCLCNRVKSIRVKTSF